MRRLPAQLSGSPVPPSGPGGRAGAIERVSVSTHAGTHLDAPYHYGPTMVDGTPARTIDKVPLSWCFSDAVVLDM
jgi:kynurenine formamidase